MTRRSSRLWLGLAAAAAVGSVALLAHAWEFKAPFDATVNGHNFHTIRLWNDDCVLKVQLKFTAPAEEYKSSISMRNYHRFKARFEMADNLTVFSPIFGNRKPGRRSYVFTKDTGAGGCWATGCSPGCAWG